MTVFLTIFGVLAFLFLFWRRLKEDYPASQIFNTSFYILFAILASDVISGYFLPLYWFWLSFFGVCLGVTVSIWRFHLRVFELIEATVAGLLPWLALIFLADFLRLLNLSSGVGALIILILAFLFYFFDTHYRGFAWYKSGRVGFSGLTIAGAFFLMRAAVAVIFPNVLSFVGGKEAVFSGILAFASFLVVFKLAREKT